MNSVYKKKGLEGVGVKLALAWGCDMGARRIWKRGCNR